MEYYSTMKSMDSCSSMDESQTPYAGQIKPDTKEDIVYDFYLHAILEKVNLVYSFAAAATKWLKQQKLTFLQCWRPEVRDQVLGRAGFF